MVRDDGDAAVVDDVVVAAIGISDGFTDGLVMDGLSVGSCVSAEVGSLMSIFDGAGVAWLAVGSSVDAEVAWLVGFSDGFLGGLDENVLTGSGV